MRIIFGVILLAFMFNSKTMQNVDEKENIIGVWQFDTKEVNAGLFDNYQFFPDGKFKFNTNQNDATRRIISIGGTYNLHNNRLQLTTTYMIEIQGGILVRSETAGGSGWEISGGELITTTYQTQNENSITIGNCEHDQQCILLDNRKYYRVEYDPNNFN